MKNNNVVILLILGVFVFGIIYLGINITKNFGKTPTAINKANAVKDLNALYKNIDVKTASVQRGSSVSADEQIAVLPDISEYPFVVNPTTDSFITIYSSTEKANEDENSWLRKVAEEFNNSNFELNGVPVSVGVRAIPSSVACDYITTEKYIPDLYIPSSDIYGKIIKDKEIKFSTESDSLVNNVSGIIISKKVKDEINSKYKASDVDTIIKSVVDGESIIGYTNPLSNEDGLNFVLTILNVFDEQNPLSNKAVEKLKAYQDKIPYVSYDIYQLEESIQIGTIDGFASNYLTYYSIPELRNNYEFVPFGIAQNQPVYTIGEISEVKSAIAKEFVNYCKKTDMQKNADSLGYNKYSDYSYKGYNYSGNDILEVQSIWKKEKNGSSDLTAVFVADMSGSMEGSPLLKLKASLNRASTFIDENTNVGLVTFSDEVNIVLPIGKFDTKQKSYFLNAVKSMRANGGTAMFNAIVVAEKMITDKQEENPNTKSMIFVLTDGESNRGYKFEDIENISREIRIPIYTIGYNADIDVLKSVSDINEASTMDADSDNVIYKLEDLFNAQM